MERRRRWRPPWGWMNSIYGTISKRDDKKRVGDRKFPVRTFFYILKEEKKWRANTVDHTNPSRCIDIFFNWMYDWLLIIKERWPWVHNIPRQNNTFFPFMCEFPVNRSTTTEVVPHNLTWVLVLVFVHFFFPCKNERKNKTTTRNKLISGFNDLCLLRRRKKKKILIIIINTTILLLLFLIYLTL
jgi:hypothetical protein